MGVGGLWTWLQRSHHEPETIEPGTTLVVDASNLVDKLWIDPPNSFPVEWAHGPSYLHFEQAVTHYLASFLKAEVKLAIVLEGIATRGRRHTQGSRRTNYERLLAAFRHRRLEGERGQTSGIGVPGSAFSCLQECCLRLRERFPDLVTIFQAVGEADYFCAFLVRYMPDTYFAILGRDGDFATLAPRFIDPTSVQFVRREGVTRIHAPIFRARDVLNGLGLASTHLHHDDEVQQHHFERLLLTGFLQGNDFISYLHPITKGFHARFSTQKIVLADRLLHVADFVQAHNFATFDDLRAFVERDLIQGAPEDVAEEFLSCLNDGLNIVATSFPPTADSRDTHPNLLLYKLHMEQEHLAEGEQRRLLRVIMERHPEATWLEHLTRRVYDTSSGDAFLSRFLRGEAPGRFPLALSRRDAFFHHRYSGHPAVLAAFKGQVIEPLQRINTSLLNAFREDRMGELPPYENGLQGCVHILLHLLLEKDRVSPDERPRHASDRGSLPSLAGLKDEARVLPEGLKREHPSMFLISAILLYLEHTLLSELVTARHLFDIYARDNEPAGLPFGDWNNPSFVQDAVHHIVTACAVAISMQRTLPAPLLASATHNSAHPFLSFLVINTVDFFDVVLSDVEVLASFLPPAPDSEPRLSQRSAYVPLGRLVLSLLLAFGTESPSQAVSRRPEVQRFYRQLVDTRACLNRWLQEHGASATGPLSRSATREPLGRLPSAGTPLVPHDTLQSLTTATTHNGLVDMGAVVPQPQLCDSAALVGYNVSPMHFPLNPDAGREPQGAVNRRRGNPIEPAEALRRAEEDMQRKGDWAKLGRLKERARGMMVALSGGSGDDGPEGQREPPMDSFQKEACQHLNYDKSVLVIAPTGAGKTRIAHHAIQRVLNLPPSRPTASGPAQWPRVVYLCPTKALVAQAFCQILAHFPNWDEHARREQGLEFVGFKTGEVSLYTHTCRVLVTVPQSFLNMHDNDEHLQVHTVIVDEIHFQNQDQKAWTVAEQVLLRKRRKDGSRVQLVGLSATIGNDVEVATWLSDTLGYNLEVVRVPETERPVPQRTFTFTETGGLRPLCSKRPRAPGALPRTNDRLHASFGEPTLGFLRRLLRNFPQTSQDTVEQLLQRFTECRNDLLHDRGFDLNDSDGDSDGSEEKGVWQIGGSEEAVRARGVQHLNWARAKVEVLEGLASEIRAFAQDPDFGATSGTVTLHLLLLATLVEELVDTVLHGAVGVLQSVCPALERSEGTPLDTDEGIEYAEHIWPSDDEVSQCNSVAELKNLLRRPANHAAAQNSDSEKHWAALFRRVVNALQEKALVSGSNMQQLYCQLPSARLQGLLAVGLLRSFAPLDRSADASRPNGEDGVGEAESNEGAVSDVVPEGEATEQGEDADDADDEDDEGDEDDQVDDPVAVEDDGTGTNEDLVRAPPPLATHRVLEVACILEQLEMDVPLLLLPAALPESEHSNADAEPQDPKQALAAAAFLGSLHDQFADQDVLLMAVVSACLKTVGVRSATANALLEVWDAHYPAWLRHNPKALTLCVAHLNEGPFCHDRIPSVQTLRDALASGDDTACRDVCMAVLLDRQPSENPADAANSTWQCDVLDAWQRSESDWVRNLRRALPNALQLSGLVLSERTSSAINELVEDLAVLAAYARHLNIAIPQPQPPSSELGPMSRVPYLICHMAGVAPLSAGVEPELWLRNIPDALFQLDICATLEVLPPYKVVCDVVDSLKRRWRYRIRPAEDIARTLVLVLNLHTRSLSLHSRLRQVLKTDLCAAVRANHHDQACQILTIVLLAVSNLASPRILGDMATILTVGEVKHHVHRAVQENEGLQALVRQALSSMRRWNRRQALAFVISSFEYLLSEHVGADAVKHADINLRLKQAREDPRFPESVRELQDLSKEQVVQHVLPSLDRAQPGDVVSRFELLDSKCRSSQDVREWMDILQDRWAGQFEGARANAGQDILPQSASAFLSLARYCGRQLEFAELSHMRRNDSLWAMESSLVALLRELNRTGDLPALLFILDTRLLQRLAHMLCVNVQQGLGLDFLKPTGQDRELVDATIRRLEAEGSADQQDIDLLRHGIGIHFRNLSEAWRLEIETLASRGALKVLFATGTLAVGIHLPVQTAVFLRSSRLMSVADFRQMSGRAGRRGLQGTSPRLGKVVICGAFYKERLESLLYDDPEPLRGADPRGLRELAGDLYDLEHGMLQSDFVCTRGLVFASSAAQARDDPDGAASGDTGPWAQMIGGLQMTSNILCALGMADEGTDTNHQLTPLGSASIELRQLENNSDFALAYVLPTVQRYVTSLDGTKADKLMALLRIMLAFCQGNDIIKLRVLPHLRRDEFASALPNELQERLCHFLVDVMRGMQLEDTKFAVREMQPENVRDEQCPGNTARELGLCTRHVHRLLVPRIPYSVVKQLCAADSGDGIDPGKDVLPYTDVLAQAGGTTEDVLNALSSDNALRWVEGVSGHSYRHVNLAHSGLFKLFVSKLPVECPLPLDLFKTVFSPLPVMVQHMQEHGSAPKHLCRVFDLSPWAVSRAILEFLRQVNAVARAVDKLAPTIQGQGGFQEEQGMAQREAADEPEPERWMQLKELTLELRNTLGLLIDDLRESNTTGEHVRRVVTGGNDRSEAVYPAWRYIKHLFYNEIRNPFGVIVVYAEGVEVCLGRWTNLRDGVAVDKPRKGPPGVVNALCGAIRQLEPDQQQNWFERMVNPTPETIGRIVGNGPDQKYDKLWPENDRSLVPSVVWVATALVAREDGHERLINSMQSNLARARLRPNRAVERWLREVLPSVSLGVADYVRARGRDPERGAAVEALWRNVAQRFEEEVPNSNAMRIVYTRGLWVGGRQVQAADYTQPLQVVRDLTDELREVPLDTLSRLLEDLVCPWRVGAGNVERHWRLQPRFLVPSIVCVAVSEAIGPLSIRREMHALDRLLVRESDERYWREERRLVPHRQVIRWLFNRHGQ